MLQTKQKAKIIEKFKAHKTDTGSSEVQAALLSEEIKKLAGHLKNHPKDNHSRRGLLGMVGRRKKHLDYISKTNPKKHVALVKKLGLKK